MSNIKKPYKIALKTPFLRVLLCLVKKETVSGIIGNTQGVSSAMKPPKKPKTKTIQLDSCAGLPMSSLFLRGISRLLAISSLRASTCFCSTWATEPSREKTKSSLRLIHTSIHAWQKIFPLICFTLGSVSFTFWVIFISFSKKSSSTPKTSLKALCSPSSLEAPTSFIPSVV